MNVADYLVWYLAELGVRHAFGVGGANIEDVYDALHRGGRVTGVLAKHEFSAATMADGYARAGERLGVVLATSGGGAMNLVPALAEAFASRVPVLAVVGQTPSPLEGRGGFQDSSGRGGSLDAHALFAAVARRCERVTRADAFPRQLHDAVAAALGETPGPAVLLIAKDVQRAAIDPGAPGYGRFPARRPPAPTGGADLDAAARLLGGTRARERGVVILAGDGVGRHDARGALARLADVLGARVLVTPDARDAFDNHHPRFGGVTGIMGHPAARRHLERAGVCLLVGTRLPHLARLGLEAALGAPAVVSVHFEPSFVDGAEVELRGHVGALLDALAARLAGARGRPAPPEPEEHLAPAFLPGARGAALSYREALAGVGAVLPDDANVFVDAGNTGASAVHHLKAPPRGRYVVALGMGGMGYSFGAAIGAAFANGRRTFVLAGDGAFFMHGLEIHTAVEYELPVTFIIFNNDAHAMCYAREQLYYGDRYTYNLFKRSEIGAGIAAMFPSLTLLGGASAAEIAAALGDPRARRGPAALVVDVDAREVPPFLPLLEALAQTTPQGREADEDRSRKAS